MLVPVELKIDHNFVRSVEDRSWTLPILDHVRRADSTDRAQCLRTLACLEDYRAIGPLTALVEDSGLPASEREGVSQTVSGFDDTTTTSRRRSWWASGDPIVMAHALRLMERDEADVVVQVAVDDGNPLQALALNTMTFSYDEPQFQEDKLRAFSHPDPIVRMPQMSRCSTTNQWRPRID